jgi:hypothetical protein
MENTEQNAQAAEGSEKLEAKTQEKGDFVEFSPEQQKKFNSMYKQARAADENNRYLMEHSKKLEETVLTLSEKLEAINSKTSLKEGHDAVTTIKAELKRAIEEGDVDKQVELNSQLADIKAEQKLKAIQPKVEPKKIEAAPQQQVDPAQQYIDYLAKEKDSSGQIIRPWLHQNDPNYERALELSKEVAQRYIDQGRTPDIARVLYDVEMEITGEAKEPTKKQAQVLSGANFTRTKSNAKLNLTDEDRKVARRMGLDVERLSKVKGIMSGRNSSVVTSEDF